MIIFLDHFSALYRPTPPAYTDAERPCLLLALIGACNPMVCPIRAVPAGPRFSVIAWGRRRTINHQNGGADEIGSRDFADGPDGPGWDQDLARTNDDAPIEEDEEGAEVGVAVTDMSEMVERFVLQETTNDKKRSDARARSKANAGDLDLGLIFPVCIRDP